MHLPSPTVTELTPTVASMSVSQPAMVDNDPSSLVREIVHRGHAPHHQAVKSTSKHKRYVLYQILYFDFIN